MSKIKTKYYYEEAFKQKRITYCTFLFILVKFILFALVIILAVLEGSLITRKLVHLNEKSLHHTGTFVNTNGDLIDSNDFVKQSRHKSNFTLFTNVRLYEKEKETTVSEHCIKEKICLRVKGCSESKCLNVKETLIEKDEEILKITDEDKGEMLRKFMFYVRPKTDYVYSKVIPNDEEVLVFYPSKQFNVFTLQTIFEKFINDHKWSSTDELAKQNWQNPQRAQEILGQLSIQEDKRNILNPLNQISLR